MRKLISFSMMVFLLLDIIVIAQPFGPPIYIADPVKMECRYYFAGNERHFNPRPENYTLDIGYTTNFKSQDQACEFWRCIYTNGTVKVDENRKPIEKDLCVCNANHYWDDVFGCVKMKEQQPMTFLQLVWKLVKRLFS